MELQGKIVKIFDTEQISDRFKKRSFVIEHGDKPEYMNPVILECQMDKVDLLDKFSVGQLVEVGLNIRGREWVSPQNVVKYFNTLIAWKINTIGDTGTVPPPPPKPGTEGDDGDSLPF